MNRKWRKLVRNPNRFFFDYFAKRLGAHSQFEVNKCNGTAGPMVPLGDFLLPPNFSFDSKIHPWVQVARLFHLRSGAITGHPDQSMLVNSTDLMDVLTYAFWVAHGFSAEVKVYALGGAVNIHVDRSSLLSMQQVTRVYAEIKNKPDFVLEIIGEFDNNFAAHLFVYDLSSGDQITVRSERAYVKRFAAGRLKDIYPAIIDEFGDWAFGTPWPVDVVYTWVNGNDPAWVDMWNRQYPEQPLDVDRFVQKEELKYSLRALCKYLPWFHRVHIVSNCGRPSWLKDHPRINWVSHEDIFPDLANLPTFNSHAIEACLHRIPGLSERFVYFNDDVFVTQPCYYTDFYDQNGRSIAQLEPYGMVAENNLWDATRDFLAPAMNCQARLLAKYPWYKATQLHKHTPYVLLKSVLEDIDREFHDDLERTRSHRLRSPEDLNVTSFLYHHYALASGNSVEGDAPYLIVRPRNIRDLMMKSSVRQYKYLCFNDGDGSAGDKDYLRAFSSLMENTFQRPGSFELNFRSWSSVRISKTIMAYKTRAHRIPYIRSRIGDAAVSLDDGCLGVFGNSRRAWSMHEEGNDFHFVIQDDAEVCQEFYRRLGDLVARCGRDKAYCLYFRLKNNKKTVFEAFNEKARSGVPHGYFIDKYIRYGIALLVPSHCVSAMIEHADELDHLGEHDDSRYSHYAAKFDLPIVYPLPSLVDQAQNLFSTIRSKSNMGMGATWYVDGPNGFNQSGGKTTEVSVVAPPHSSRSISDAGLDP